MRYFSAKKPATTVNVNIASLSDNVVPMYDYKIYSMNPSGKSSQLLELCSNQGEITAAYIRNGKDGIAVGAQLKNVRFEEKSNSFGKYILLADYEVAV